MCDRVGLIGSADEHAERCRLYLAMARLAPSRADRFRLAVAAVYSARAIADQLLVAACERGGKELQRELDLALQREVPHFRLIDYLRLQDFHREALPPPEHDRVVLRYSGPATLRSRQGGAVAFGGLGEILVKERNSSISEDRPIRQRDDGFWDYDRSAWVNIEEAIRQYLPAILGQVAVFARAASNDKPADREPDGAGSSGTQLVSLTVRYDRAKMEQSLREEHPS